jgi:hypothetical protein
MVGEAEGRAAETSEDIEIGSLGGEREGQRGQRCLAVQPGTSQARAGQEVSDGFQAILRILFGGRGLRQIREKTCFAFSLGVILSAAALQPERRISRAPWLDILVVPATENRQGVGHDCDFGGQRAQQFAVGFNMNRLLHFRFTVH